MYALLKDIFTGLLIRYTADVILPRISPNINPYLVNEIFEIISTTLLISEEKPNLLVFPSSTEIYFKICTVDIKKDTGIIMYIFFINILSNSKNLERENNKRNNKKNNKKRLITIL